MPSVRILYLTNRIDSKIPKFQSSFFSADLVAVEKLSFYFLMMLKVRKITLFFEAAVLCPVSFNSQIILRI